MPYKSKHGHKRCIHIDNQPNHKKESLYPKDEVSAFKLVALRKLVFLLRIMENLDIVLWKSGVS